MNGPFRKGVAPVGWAGIGEWAAGVMTVIAVHRGWASLIADMVAMMNVVQNENGELDSTNGQHSVNESWSKFRHRMKCS